MLKYIPHANNTHSWRTFLFIFFVTVISAGSAYLVYAYPKVLQKNTAVQETVNIQSTQGSTVIETVSIPEVPALLLVQVKIIDTPPSPPIEGSKDIAAYLGDAKKYVQPRILMGKYIDISLKYQDMVIFENGIALDAYQISSGKKGLDTPVGTFKIENKSPRAWSKAYGLWMPSWMAILPTGKIGIHELPVWPGGYQEGADHLGIPVSHGCVRLGVGAAKRVYDWAEVGTPVIIHQ